MEQPENSLIVDPNKLIQELQARLGSAVNENAVLSTVIQDLQQRLTETSSVATNEVLETSLEER